MYGKPPMTPGAAAILRSRRPDQPPPVKTVSAPPMGGMRPGMPGPAKPAMPTPGGAATKPIRGSGRARK